MKSRIEEVFSVERLRRTWNGDGEAPRTPGSEEEGDGEGTHGAIPLPVAVIYRRLCAAIAKHFPGKQAEALTPLVNELERHLSLCFPKDLGNPLSKEELTACQGSIERLLDQIEDLAEALDMSARG